MKRMKELIKKLEQGTIDNDNLRTILNDEFNMGFNTTATREEMENAFIAMYKDNISIADEIAYENMEVEI